MAKSPPHSSAAPSTGLHDGIVARLSGVHHRYKKVRALDGIDLELPAHRRVGFIGPDGVGKSSVLALLAGARKLQTGRVLVLGHDLADPHARIRVQPRIAYMPQGLGRNLYPTLSVEENVDFFARLFGQGPAERRQRIDELLHGTGLAAFRGRPASKLSGGMKQKLGLCCALIHDPDLLILDEPTTGVDPLSRRQFWRLIEHIRARRPGMSVVIATAYMEEAARFDWLVAMDQGRVLGTGSPTELMARTGRDSLEEAFIALLPEDKRRSHKTLVIPPRSQHDDVAVIEATDLTKRFGDFTAVDRVSFRIARGEIFGFLGSNGSGKTTTMKMLTGLLPPTSGTARLFGRPVSGHMAARNDVGYMTQAFSLYGELTVRQNLELHARLFHIARPRARIAALADRFGLTPHLDSKPDALPLGIRQRLSLAVAVVHEPKLLILDEPTSGVDPIARDELWALLVELSRKDGVTLFVSTHFMNEASRCDRVSLMHNGKVLASDTPDALVAQKGVDNLEQAFIAYLEEVAAPDETRATPLGPAARPDEPSATPRASFSPRRLLAYAYRESLELRRDRLRLVFALLGSVVLMLFLGYGISMDVEDLPFAVLDRDQTPASRDYVQHIAASRYFVEQPPLESDADMQRALASGRVSLALEIPDGFGADLRAGRTPEVGLWLDGAMTTRAETARGYAEAMHNQYVTDLVERTTGAPPPPPPVELLPRYRYNQAFRSIHAMVPAVIPILLILIPAMLTALGVVREKELGSITNFYVTPVTRLEFLLGKQLPYIGVAMLSLLLLVLQAVLLFGVPVTGSLTALFLLGFLYVAGTTGIGVLVSTVTRSQVAAIAATAVITMIPSVQFAGLTAPVSSLSGPAQWIGQVWPATHFVVASRGIFTKALGLDDLGTELFALSIFPPLFLLLSTALLSKQER